MSRQPVLFWLFYVQKCSTKIVGKPLVLNRFKYCRHSLICYLFTVYFIYFLCFFIEVFIGNCWNLDISICFKNYFIEVTTGNLRNLQQPPPLIYNFKNLLKYCSYKESSTIFFIYLFEDRASVFLAIIILSGGFYKLFPPEYREKLLGVNSSTKRNYFREWLNICLSHFSRTASSGV